MHGKECSWNWKLTFVNDGKKKVLVTGSVYPGTALDLTEFDITECQQCFMSCLFQTVGLDLSAVMGWMYFDLWGYIYIVRA